MFEYQLLQLYTDLLIACSMRERLIYMILDCSVVLLLLGDVSFPLRTFHSIFCD